MQFTLCQLCITKATLETKRCYVMAVTLVKDRDCTVPELRRPCPSVSRDFQVDTSPWQEGLKLHFTFTLPNGGAQRQAISSLSGAILC